MFYRLSEEGLDVFYQILHLTHHIEDVFGLFTASKYSCKESSHEEIEILFIFEAFR